MSEMTEPENTETIETVEVGIDRVCSICKQKIPAGESHNETVRMTEEGRIIGVVDWYHEECPD